MQKRSTESTGVFVARRKKGRSTLAGGLFATTSGAEVLRIMVDHQTWADMLEIFATPPDLAMHGVPLLAGIWGLIMTWKFRQEASFTLEEQTGAHNRNTLLRKDR